MKPAFAAITSIAMLAGPALAGQADTGWVAGAAVAFGDYELDDKKVDDSSAGVSLAAGYRFNRWFGLEGGFLSIDGIEEGNSEVDLSGLSFNGLFHLPSPSEEVGFFVKTGFFSYDQDLLTDGSSSQSRKVEGFLAGAGTAITVADQVSLRVGYNWYDIDDANFWMVDVGVQYHFGRPNN